MPIDEAKLNEFMGGFVHDIGAVLHAATVVLGDQPGLYKALACQRLTPPQLANRKRRSTWSTKQGREKERSHATVRALTALQEHPSIGAADGQRGA